jgi:hypothetical protein
MSKFTLALLILSGALILIAAVPYAVTVTIDWWAVGPGSDTLTNGDLSLVGMAGQAVGFEVGEGDYALYSGYLYLPYDLFRYLFLPMILK